MSVATSTAIIAGAAIAGGTTAAGAYVSAHGQTTAAKTQAASADKALEFAKEKFNQQEANNQPYMQLGMGALGRLGYGMGLSGYENPNKLPAYQPPALATNPTTTPPPAPAAPQTLFQRLAAQHNQPPQAPTAGGGLVTLRAPTGEMQQVPQEQVAFYQSHGAQIVQGGAPPMGSLPGDGTISGRSGTPFANNYGAA